MTPCGTLTTEPLNSACSSWIKGGHWKSLPCPELQVRDVRHGKKDVAGSVLQKKV